MGEFDAVRNFFGFPDGLIKAIGAAVQSIGTVILRKLIGLAVQGEFAVGNAVTITPNDGAEKRGLVGPPVNVRRLSRIPARRRQTFRSCPAP